MKKDTIKNKTDKNLRCKDCTDNFKPLEIKMTNKVLREKSDCVICRSSQPRFLKQKHNNKK